MVWAPEHGLARPFLGGEISQDLESRACLVQHRMGMGFDGQGGLGHDAVSNKCWGRYRHKGCQRAWRLSIFHPQFPPTLEPA